MTPTEQDKESKPMTNYNERLDDLTSFMESIGWEFDENGYTFDDNYINFRTSDMLRQAITADRKRVALEARLDERQMLNFHRAYGRDYQATLETLEEANDERIAELKAQQEEV